jgi:hypothetical protein
MPSPPFNGRGAQLQLQYRASTPATGFLTNVAGPWSPTAGSTWTEPSGGGKQGAAGGDGFLLSAQTGSDFTYEGDVRVVSGVAAALTFRSNADASQHYTVNVHAGLGVKMWRPGMEIALYPTSIVTARRTTSRWSPMATLPGVPGPRDGARHRRHRHRLRQRAVRAQSSPPPPRAVPKHPRLASCGPRVFPSGCAPASSSGVWPS